MSVQFDESVDCCGAGGCRKGPLRLFVSGKMRGLPDYNYPKFEDAKFKLECHGHIVTTPVDLDRELGLSPEGIEKDFMNEALLGCMKAILGGDGIVVLPEGWNESAGVKAEIATARAAGIPVYEISPDGELIEFNEDQPGKDILLEAIDITSHARQTCYGSPNRDFHKVAQIWSAILDAPVKASHVALCMIGLKLSRQSHAHKTDNWRDIAGYARCGFQVAEEEQG